MRRITKVIVAIITVVLVMPVTVAHLYNEDDVEGKINAIEDLLDSWCIEYDIDPEQVQFMGYKDLGHMTSSGYGWVMGQCWYYSDKPCEIWLDDAWEDMKLGWLETSTLWHEYCHAECYLEDHVSDGHNDYFQKQKRRNLTYWFGDMVVKIVFPFL